MQSKTALIVFGTFLAINLAGFGAAVVLQQLRGGAADEDRYGGLSESAFAVKVVADTVAALDGPPADDVSMEMVAKTEAGEVFATMVVAVSNTQRAFDMHWTLDLELLQTYAPVDDPTGTADLEVLGMALAEFRVTQVGDRLVLLFADDTYEMRGVPPPDTGSMSGFVAQPVPGLGEAGGESGDPTGFFDVLRHSTEGLTITGLSEGSFRGTSAWRVTATFASADAVGEATYIAAQSDLRPLVVSMQVRDPARPAAPAGDLTFTFTYGPAVSVELPPTDGATRLPASSDAERTDDSPRRIEAVMGPDATPVPLEEMELRVVEYRPSAGGFGPQVTKVLATMRLDDESRDQSGYRFTFADDGDGLLSPGDRYVVEVRGGANFSAPVMVNGSWQPGVDVLLYDRWAQKYEGAPGAGLGAGLLGLLGAALVAAARRRGAA